MEFAGIVLIGIGVNTFMNGIWLILYNQQNKKIDSVIAEQNKRIEKIENHFNK